MLTDPSYRQGARGGGGGQHDEKRQIFAATATPALTLGALRQVCSFDCRPADSAFMLFQPLFKHL